MRVVTGGRTWFVGSAFRPLLVLLRRFNTPASIWQSCNGRLLGLARVRLPSGGRGHPYPRLYVAGRSAVEAVKAERTATRRTCFRSARRRRLARVHCGRLRRHSTPEALRQPAGANGTRKRRECSGACLREHGVAHEPVSAAMSALRVIRVRQQSDRFPIKAGHQTAGKSRQFGRK